MRRGLLPARARVVVIITILPDCKGREGASGFANTIPYVHTYTPLACENVLSLCGVAAMERRMTTRFL